jgi:hypothetical protein
MTPITLVLRASKSPAASAPTGGELSSAEIDANWSNTKTACDELAIETKTVIVGTALATTGTINLDLSVLTGTVQRITLTGNPTFTTSNRASGRLMQLRLAAGGSARTLAWPAGWVAFGVALPTALASGAVLRVAIECHGTADTDIDATSVLSA